MLAGSSLAGRTLARSGDWLSILAVEQLWTVGTDGFALDLGEALGFGRRLRFAADSASVFELIMPDADAPTGSRRPGIAPSW